MGALISLAPLVASPGWLMGYALLLFLAWLPSWLQRRLLRRVATCHFTAAGRVHLRLFGGGRWEVEPRGAFVHPWLIVVPLRVRVPARLLRGVGLVLVLPRWAYPDELHRALRRRLREFS